jgi:hypothetical protein
LAFQEKIIKYIENNSDLFGGLKPVLVLLPEVEVAMGKINSEI